MAQEQRHGSKLLARLGATCALALVCACVPARQAVAQSSSAASNPVSKSKTTATSHSPATGKSTASPVVKSSKASSKTATHGKSKRRRKSARGQQKIDPERAEAIQEALVREHYLSGTAAGTWNQASEDAMRRYQADHGWQSKTVPDSRALISLGLGPSHDHLLNPDSAMTTEPSVPRAASLTPASHSAEPGARMSASPAATSDQNAPAPQ